MFPRDGLDHLPTPMSFNHERGYEDADAGGWRRQPVASGWNGMLDSFRIKPDEFPNPVNFYVQSVKLTASSKRTRLTRFDGITATREPPAPTLQFFLGHDGHGLHGTQMCRRKSHTGTYGWNTSALANGTYYIFPPAL